MPRSSDLSWLLTTIGEVSVSVHTGAAEDEQLSATFEPVDGGVRVAAKDDGLTEVRSVVATLAHADFEAFARDVAEAMDGPGGNCGTHGFWVTRAHVDLPLSTRTIEGETREQRGFSSEPVAHALMDIVEKAAALPGAEAEFWRAVRRRAKLKIYAVSIALVLSGAALWLWLR
jgi:hypothetical protein